MHWLGLFDAVERMDYLGRVFPTIGVEAPNNPWAKRLTTNVVWSSHLVKSTFSIIQNVAFYTSMDLGNPEELPGVPPSIYLDRTRRKLMVDHGYIGTIKETTEALDWMSRRARQKNVPVK